MTIHSKIKQLHFKNIDLLLLKQKKKNKDCQLNHHPKMLRAVSGEKLLLLVGREAKASFSVEE